MRHNFINSGFKNMKKKTVKEIFDNNYYLY